MASPYISLGQGKSTLKCNFIMKWKMSKKKKKTPDDVF